jgi:hypothetical protein
MKPRDTEDAGFLDFYVVKAFTELERTTSAIQHVLVISNMERSSLTFTYQYPIRFNPRGWVDTPGLAPFLKFERT